MLYDTELPTILTAIFSLLIHNNVPWAERFFQLNNTWHCIETVCYQTKIVFVKSVMVIIKWVL